MYMPLALGIIPRIEALSGRSSPVPLRGGAGRDPDPPLVFPANGGGGGSLAARLWTFCLWCGLAVPHCARPLWRLLKRCSCSRREVQELRSSEELLLSPWPGGRSGQWCHPVVSPWERGCWCGGVPLGLHGQRHPSRRPPRPTSHTSVPARNSAVLRPLVKYPRFVMRGMRVGPNTKKKIFQNHTVSLYTDSLYDSQKCTQSM